MVALWAIYRNAITTDDTCAAASPATNRLRAVFGGICGYGLARQFNNFFWQGSRHHIIGSAHSCCVINLV
jgi:hypothetical protein